MKWTLTICAGVLFALVAGYLFLHHVHTGLHDAVAQVTKFQNEVSVITSVPIPSPPIDGRRVPPRVLADDPQASQEIAQPDHDVQGLRARRFLLERFYPDVQKEAGFGPDDFEKLVSLNGSDEAEMEAALGSEKYQRWKEYKAKVDAKAALGRLNRNLSGDDQLREDQADMLYKAIFDEQRRRSEELRIRAYAAPSDPRLRLDFEFSTLEIKEESTRRLISAAKPFLTERQFAVLPEAIVDPNLAGYRENLERIRKRMDPHFIQ